MAILAWVKSQQLFLKIQEGTGDALTVEDRNEGMEDYVLWSTFRPDCLDIDETLTMELLDGGMLMFKSAISAIEALPDCYAAVVGKPYDEADVIVLLQDNGASENLQ